MNTALYGLSFNSGGIMKKLIIIALVLSVTVFSLLSILKDKFFLKEYDPHDFKPRQEKIYTEATAMKILECFDNRDVDSLITMFSESVRSSYDLHSQIKKAFDIYGEKSVTNDGFEDYGYSNSSSRDGIYVQKSIRGHIKNIKTSNNDVLTISFIKCVLDDDNPNNLGLKDIYLIDLKYGTLAKIGRVDSQDMNILEDNNKKRNADKSLGRN